MGGTLKWYTVVIDDTLRKGLVLPLAVKIPQGNRRGKELTFRDRKIRRAVPTPSLTLPRPGSRLLHFRLRRCLRTLSAYSIVLAVLWSLFEHRSTGPSPTYYRPINLLWLVNTPNYYLKPFLPPPQSPPNHFSLSRTPISFISQPQSNANNSAYFPFKTP